MTTCGCHESYPQTNPRLIAHGPGCPIYDLARALRDMLDRFAPTADGLGKAEIACAQRAREALAVARPNPVTLCFAPMLVGDSEGEERCRNPWPCRIHGGASHG